MVRWIDAALETGPVALVGSSTVSQHRLCASCPFQKRLVIRFHYEILKNAQQPETMPEPRAIVKDSFYTFAFRTRAIHDDIIRDGDIDSEAYYR